MAYMSIDFSREIAEVISLFEEEVSRIEAQKLFAAIYGKNPPTAYQNYRKQRQRDNQELHDALYRSLYRVFGTEEQQERIFKSPAQQAVQRELEDLEDKINKHNRITIDLDF